MAKLTPIPGHEFERFLTAKGVTANCVACELGDLIIHDEELAGTHVAWSHSSSPTSSPSLRTTTRSSWWFVGTAGRIDLLTAPQ